MVEKPTRLDCAAEELWLCFREIGHTLSSEVACKRVRRQLEQITKTWQDHITKLETDLKHRDRKIAELKREIAEGVTDGRSRTRKENA